MRHSSSRNNPKGFRQCLNRILPKGLIRKALRLCGPASRRPPILSAPDLIHAIVFHVLQGAGTLAQHVSELFGILMSDSALSQRHACMPWQLFERLLELALGPKADPVRHPGAFYKGLRLCGIDGVQFSVRNTSQNLEALTKAATRRAKAAFAKMGAVAIVELGLRNPIAAVVGPNGESEMALARTLVEDLPAQSLSIWDRLYGIGAMVAMIAEIHPQGDRQFLLRVKGNLKARVIHVLRDGSALVEVRSGKRKFVVREIRGRVRRPKGTWTEVRLWTSLLDCRAFPAKELLVLYGRRWETEVAYKELKVDLRRSNLLGSHTPLTVAQEIAALFLAQAMLAEMRIEAAETGEVAPLQISFIQTLRWARLLWQFLELGADLMSSENLAEFINRVLIEIAASVVKPRRQRSCARAVRQPIKSWPRLLQTTYSFGPTEYELTPHAA